MFPSHALFTRYLTCIACLVMDYKILLIYRQRVGIQFPLISQKQLPESTSNVEDEAEEVIEASEDDNDTEAVTEEPPCCDNLSSNTVQLINDKEDNVPPGIDDNIAETETETVEKGDQR